LISGLETLKKKNFEIDYESSGEIPVFDYSGIFTQGNSLVKTLIELFNAEEYKPVKNENSKHK